MLRCDLTHRYCRSPTARGADARLEGKAFARFRVFATLGGFDGISGSITGTCGRADDVSARLRLFLHIRADPLGLGDCNPSDASQFPIVLLSFVVPSFLSELGIDIGPLRAGAGIVGFAVSFGHNATSRKSTNGAEVA